MPNEDDISAGAEAGTGISQGLRHPLPRLAAASDPTKTSKIGMGRGSLHPHTAPGPPKDAQDKLSVAGRRLAVHSTGKPASSCRQAAFWEQPLCQHPMTQQEQTHHKDVMDGACPHVISLAPWWWEGTGKHSSASCTMSLNQHQTSTNAPTATVTSQCPQSGTLHLMAMNSQLSGVSHASSFPGLEQSARHQDQRWQSQ